jgi:hypothetical protein
VTLRLTSFQLLTAWSTSATVAAREAGAGRSWGGGGATGDDRVGDFLANDVVRSSRVPARLDVSRHVSEPCS